MAGRSRIWSRIENDGDRALKRLAWRLAAGYVVMGIAVPLLQPACAILPHSGGHSAAGRRQSGAARCSDGALHRKPLRTSAQ